MASTKRKPSVKRTAKNATNNVRRSAQQFTRQATSAAQTASRAGLDAAAQLYQIPFAGGDVGAATKQAAQAAQSATENMVKMGTDFWQNVMNSQNWSTPTATSAPWGNLFANMPQFPGIPGMNGQASQQMKNFGHDSAKHFQRTATGAQQKLTEAAEIGRENVSTYVECGNIAAGVSKEMGAELVNYANRTFAQNVELSKQILGCRTLNDMFDLSGKFVKSNLDNFFSESVKMSEMFFQCASDVSEPLNERLSDTTERLTKTFAA